MKILQNIDKIKASVNAIKASRGKIDDLTVVSKVFRTLIPIYVIRASSI